MDRWIDSTHRYTLVSHLHLFWKHKLEHSSITILLNVLPYDTQHDDRLQPVLFTSWKGNSTAT